jgi:hypothetical protein
MMRTFALSNPAVRVVITDVLVLLLVFLIPALSHLSPFPLYWMEPMRLFVLLGYFLSRNIWNASILAFSVPLFSMWMTGHPIFLKSLLISLELCANVLILHWLWKTAKAPLLPALLGSVFVSKLWYYLLKYSVILAGGLSGTLVSTPLSIQFASMAGISMLYFLLFGSYRKPRA